MLIEEAEPYSSLWSTCYELWGAMNAAQYKDYVLALLTVKYISAFAPHITHNQAIRSMRTETHSQIAHFTRFAPVSAVPNYGCLG